MILQKLTHPPNIKENDCVVVLVVVHDVNLVPARYLIVNFIYLRYPNELLFFQIQLLSHHLPHVFTNTYEKLMLCLRIRIKFKNKFYFRNDMTKVCICVDEARSIRFEKCSTTLLGCINKTIKKNILLLQTTYTCMWCIEYVF